MNKYMLMVLMTVLMYGSASAIAKDKPYNGENNITFFDSGKFTGLPFSDGVKVGNVLFLSGEIASERQPDNTFRVIPGGIKTEKKRFLRTLKLPLMRKGMR